MVGVGDGVGVVGRDQYPPRPVEHNRGRGGGGGGGGGGENYGPHNHLPRIVVQLGREDPLKGRRGQGDGRVEFREAVHDAVEEGKLVRKQAYRRGGVFRGRGCG